MDEKTTQRILVFATNYLPNIGGAELAFHEVAIRIPEISFDLITLRLSDPLDRKKLLPSEEKFSNVNVYRVGSRLNLVRLILPKNLYPIAAYIKARELAKKFGPYKKVYALQASQGGGGAWLFKIFNPGVIFLLNLQEGKDLKKQGFLMNFFRDLIIKKADVIIAISNYLKNYARQLNKKAKILVIPNGVDIGNFSKDYSYGELSLVADGLGIKPGEKTIISVSRLVPKNGIDILIRALEVLNYKLQTTNYKLLIIGEGEQKNELIVLARELNILDDIIFAGAITHGNLPKYLKISDVFVRPSRSEGLGNAFLEAMAAGVPIIGTKVGGIPDFLKDGETGFFCKVEDPGDLARKINLLLSDKELTTKITKNAQLVVSEKYDWNLIAEKFREIYDTN